MQNYHLICKHIYLRCFFVVLIFFVLLQLLLFRLALVWHQDLAR